MKSLRLNNLSFYLCIVLAFILMSAKKDGGPSEVKVNDFKTLRSLFSAPPAEYTTAPFFVWDAKITKDEIVKDLNSFKEQGSLQVIVHPRPGLVNEYLSDEWFDLFRFTVEKGKQLGMKVWIYDENSYPSGFGGGHVPDEMPESYNQGQGLVMTHVSVLPDTVSKYFICLKQTDGKYIDITSGSTQEKGKKGDYFLFSKTYNGKSDWYGGFSYVDLLYPGVTQKFIDVTMKVYEKYIGNEFGNTVPGNFTDEPQIESPGGMRWTPDLFDRFSEQWHYDLKTQLPSLFEETGDWKKVRHNYVQTLLNLFIERWSKPWYSYTETKNLKFTGHYWEHDWPNMNGGGDNMAMYAWHQVPAIDMLFNQWDDSTSKAQFGNIRSVKELASAANQTGRQRKLSETYGGSGWDLNFRDMKRNGDWEYALGVNLMNQHLTYFSMAGARKYDYPPTFDYHEPWWKYYGYLNNHYARLSLALSSGLQKNDILIIEPTTTCWMYDSYAEPGKQVREIGQAFQSFITKLEKAQVEYDLGSENIIKDRGSVGKGVLNVGYAAYSRIVIPPKMENINSSTFNLLKKFVAGGGMIIACSQPTVIDGSPSEEVRKFFDSPSPNIKIINDPVKILLTNILANKGLTFNEIKGGTIYHHRRVLGDGQVIFIINADLNSDATGSFSTKGNQVIAMNTFDGSLGAYPVSRNGSNLTVKYSLPPAGSLLLYVAATSQGSFAQTDSEKGSLTEVAASQMQIAAKQANVLTIDFCDLTVGNETTKDLNTYYAADKAFKYYGFKNGNPWNTSVQFRKNITDRDTFGIKTGFSATYHFVVNGSFVTDSVKAVVERAPLWKVFINGKEISAEKGKWWLDRSFNIYNIGAYIRNGDNELTLKCSPMKVDSEIEPVYITGNFSVKPAKKGWVIEEPVRELGPGSWKSQGMPFYSDGVTYTRKFTVSQTGGSWIVGPGKWNGTMATVTVNGKEAGIIAFPPYKLDISKYITKGDNSVSITVIGSRKNLLGPHHNQQKEGFVSPWIWRNVKTYPSGSEYQLIDYGLFEDFSLKHSAL